MMYGVVRTTLLMLTTIPFAHALQGVRLSAKDPLLGTIMSSQIDNYIDEREAKSIVAEVEKDGVDLRKANIVLDLYQSIPITLWGPEYPPATRTTSREANLVFRKFILRHQKLLKERIGDSLFAFDNHLIEFTPLPGPPPALPHTVEFVTRSPAHLQHRGPFIRYTADHVTVEGRNHLLITGQDFKLRFGTLDGGKLIRGQTYFHGMSLRIGPYLVRSHEESGVKYTIHELEYDANGKISKLGLSWVMHDNQTRSEICPGYIFYRAPLTNFTS